MTRRGWGEGSLYQRKSDGRWIGSVVHPDGGRRYVTGADPNQVKRRLRELRSSSSRRRAAGSVKAHLDRWLADVAPSRLRPSTLEAYQRLVDLHIVPAVGSIALRSLAPADVQRMVNGMLAAGLAPQTARHAHKVLRVALTQAARWELVDRNVAALVAAPKVPRQDHTTLDAGAAAHFLEASRGDPLWPLYVVAITTGMRRGEILALRWPDIDLERGRLTVRASLRPVVGTRGRKWELDPPKTELSRRTLPLTTLAIAGLRDQKRRATSASFVFARADGRPLPGAEVTRAFQAALERAGLPRMRFHDARHTAAGLMLDESGGDLRQVMAMFGHSTITTTVDLYGGRAEAAKRKAADAMERLFGHLSAEEG